MTTECMICGAPSEPAFAKDFHGDTGLGVVEYARCQRCGFTFSTTHREMPIGEWMELNEHYHTQAFTQGYGADDPMARVRLVRQADVIRTIWGSGAIDTDLPRYDYGAGHAFLSELLASMQLAPYERYVRRPDVEYIGDAQVDAGGFGLVTAMGVIEHIMERPELDRIAKSVDAERGVLAVHTHVGRSIPPEPGWFYLLPGHVSIFTDEAMRMLMRQWGFRASLYVPHALLWMFFRHREPADLAADTVRATGYTAWSDDGFVTA